MKLQYLFLLFLPISIFAFDFYFFVQLWPPSWLIHDKTNYNFNNNYFTVHGIWPQYDNGSWPEFCNKSISFNLSALDPIKFELEEYWTNFRDPSDFWKHEYEKHFSCCSHETYFQSELDCFNTGLQLRTEYDLFHTLKNNSITPNKTPILLTNFYDVIKQKFGYNTVIICDNHGILNEIRLCLDKNLNLFDCPYTAYNEQCKQHLIYYLEYTN